MQAVQLEIQNLPIATVDVHSPVPLYHQIYLDLKRMIGQEIIPPGAILPPEMEICQAYGVGRQTVRQAIARLVDENLVERYAGKGTFVKSQAERLKFYLDRSFTQQARAMGYTPRSEVLCVEKGVVDATYPDVLHRYLGERCLNLERLRFGDEASICYQATTLLLERCPGIENHDFSRESLYDVLASEYRLVIQRIDYVVRAVSADEYRAELLNVEPGSALLFVGTAAYLENKSLIEYTAGYYRADRYEYSMAYIYSEG